MVSRSLTLICLFCYALNACMAYRILGVFPMGARSHWILGNTLMKGIAEAGHDVTMISPSSDQDPPKNGKFTEIILDGIQLEFLKMIQQLNVSSMNDESPYWSIHYMHRFGAIATEVTLKHKKVKNLLASKEKFDVVIVTEFLNDALKGFAKHFDAHLVLFSNLPANSWFNHLVGNPSLPSYDPELLLQFPPKMCFFQRLQNTIFKIVHMSYKHFVSNPQQNDLLQKYYPNPMDFNDVLYNTSLVLLNSHPSLTTPRALVPNVIEIGGFHVLPTKKFNNILLQKFMDDSKNGVIYINLGSNFKSNVELANKTDQFVTAFSKRNENILWKWEDQVLPGKTENIRIERFLPQQDILAHPNVRAFITHGGFLSTIEAIHNGVPIIAIPLGGDQKSHAASAEEAGYGIAVNLNEISEEKISWALEEIVSNPKYKDVAKEKSAAIRDRQVKPIDDAVYWIEYVIRYKGAPHLRVPYLDLKWYQYYLLDVFGVIFSIILTTLLTVKVLFSYIFCRRKSNIPVKKIKKTDKD